jgi:hypothetical protein
MPAWHTNGSVSRHRNEAHTTGTAASRGGPEGLDALAFGLPEVPVLLTPVMPAAMNEAVRYVVAQAVAKVSWA